MPQNIFKIYDGRTNFWQWDVKQKLIVLDESITQVHFSNRNMTHSIKRDVYACANGLRVCNVPSDLLKMPANLVAYAIANGMTKKAVKFAVMRRQMPSDYIPDQNESASYIVDCKINEDDHLVVVLSDGRTIDAGYVGATDGSTFVPHISEDNILTWTNNGGLENPEPVDLNPFDEWATLPNEGIDSEYEWETL